MGGRSDAVPVFNSARAGSSFAVWLFRKLTPEARRLALAFAAASLPRWDASWHTSRDRRVRRHGPDIFELRVTSSTAAQRPLGRRPARPAGPSFSVGVFFLQEAHATIVLSGAALTASSRKSWPGTPGLGEARLQLRDLRQAEREGSLRQRLVLDIFEEIKGTGGCTLHPPPRVSLLAADAPELLDLRGLREAVFREAQREGPEAVVQLEQYEDRFATAAQVVQRACRRGSRNGNWLRRPA